MPKLILVPTPIGNLEDITLRSLNVLKRVSLILAEDTRTSGLLLQHYEIKCPMQSYHKYNEHQALERLCERIEQEGEVALITDAGTPAISDPGAETKVAAVREISKLYEEVVRGSLAEVIQHFTEHEPRGEFVLIVGKSTVSDKKQNIIDPIHSSSDEEDRRKMKRSKKWNK